jgi:hypothetical protein
MLNHIAFSFLELLYKLKNNIHVYRTYKILPLPQDYQMPFQRTRFSIFSQSGTNHDIYKDKNHD